MQTFLITDSAANKIIEICAKNKLKNNILRVQLVGGGCSGFSYKFLPTEKIEENDTIYQKNQATIIIDPYSLPLLKDAELDYSESLVSSGFTVKNPNATSVCGCGTSFSA